MDFEGIKIIAGASVVRGPVSWNYFYVFLGFTLTIESTLIGMITPMVFPENMVVFALVAAITTHAVLFNGRIQNKILALKQWYETKPR